MTLLRRDYGPAREAPVGLPRASGILGRRKGNELQRIARRAVYESATAVEFEGKMREAGIPFVSSDDPPDVI
jgi:hypothetical protein